MKNFKKVLALVLVLASLLGLATMASATEYKDADKIDASYDEAIKVLDLIETMQGYPTGEFKPTATITREEAAKVIAIFDNQDSDISTYYTSINPFADEKGRWGESYVGYGYRAGIIAGMNATTFAPTANVTGTQFLKMALVTLGYDQEAEGFVGSSWAVNVLALAKRIGLIDDLKDGWKPENALTRQEAAQILLNALNAETVEYGNEAKPIDSKVWVEKENGYVLNGKFYMTVAGAVKTGKYLYESFGDLSKDTKASDAFYRPYVKWTKDHKSVETMKAAKATFTKQVSVCDILTALGIKEDDTKTKIVIDNVYCDGIEDEDSKLVTDGNKELTADYNGKKDVEFDDQAWGHSTIKCSAKDAKVGAQGTLTQVFYMGKDSEGVKHYRVCSIETWLAKVEYVNKTSTSRDNHKKGEDNVYMTVYTYDDVDGKGTAQAKEYNYFDYCDEGHCDKGFKTKEYKEGEYVTFSDPTGIAKGDYVLVTYSWRGAYEDNSDFDEGVQSVDVTEGKEGRLSGFKANNVADPSETRIGSEYVVDSTHFHLGYDASKTNVFGNKLFFYDAYGYVIGMKDTKDTSKYAVLDKVYVEHSEGVATLYANVVSMDASIAKKVVVKDFTYNDELSKDTWKDEYNSLADFANFELTGTDGENYMEFVPYYDALGKASVNSKGEYTLSRDDEDAKDVTWFFDTDGATFVKGEPTIKLGDDEYKVNSETQFLVRTGDWGDGEYVAWTGYKTNSKSVKAQGYDVVLNDDGYAEVVYLYNEVVFTDGKVVAYVFNNADQWQGEEEEDGTVYYYLDVYINGTKETVRIDKSNADKFLDEDFGDEFVKLQYVEIDKVSTVKIVEESFKLDTAYDVKAYDDGVLEIDGTFDGTSKSTMALADDCAIYSIQTSGKIESEKLEYLDDHCDSNHKVYVDWNDKNDDSVNKIVAIYVIEDDLYD